MEYNKKTELRVSFALHDKCLLSIITASLLPLMSSDMLYLNGITFNEL